MSILEVIKNIPVHNKLGLGLGATSLGIGITNLRLNKSKNNTELEKYDVEKRSLAALERIHKALRMKETKTNV